MCAHRVEVGNGSDEVVVEIEVLRHGHDVPSLGSGLVSDGRSSRRFLSIFVNGDACDFVRQAIYVQRCCVERVTSLRQYAVGGA